MVEVHKKTWGREEWITNNKLYCGKLLYIEKDKYCSLHYHIKKTEDFYVLKGSIKFEAMSLTERQAQTMKQGDVVHIPPYLVHRFTGLEEENVLIEVSTEHFENDSFRLEPSCKGD